MKRKKSIVQSTEAGKLYITSQQLFKDPKVMNIILKHKEIRKILKIDG